MIALQPVLRFVIMMVLLLGTGHLYAVRITCPTGQVDRCGAATAWLHGVVSLHGWRRGPGH